MAQTFSDLPEEKQRQILDAAAEVFSREEYKRSSTDDIAARAGISKGLLFYYFKNKSNLYLHVADHLRSLVERQLKREQLANITDFFDMLDYGAEEKLRIFQCQPWVLDLALRLYYATDKDVAAPLRRRFMEMLEEMWDVYFSHIDLGKFQPEINPRQVLDQLIYLIDGYLHQQMMTGRKISMDALMAEYATWRKMLRQYAYKEEYQ